MKHLLTVYFQNAKVCIWIDDITFIISQCAQNKAVRTFVALQGKQQKFCQSNNRFHWRTHENQQNVDSQNDASSRWPPLQAVVPDHSFNMLSQSQKVQSNHVYWLI